jgi:hypothetical protein
MDALKIREEMDRATRRMAADASPPEINNRYVCIVDRESVALAALISSYLFKPASDLPLFLFPAVKSSRTEEDTQFRDQYLSNLMGRTASTLINNAWARMGECEYVILAGLNDHQKSYLHLPNGVRIIEIVTVTDISSKLTPFVQGREEFKCKSSDILRGLAVALKDGKRLVIDETAEPVPEISEMKKGIVVVEYVDDASPVIAINYAVSVDARISIVDPLAEHEGRSVQRWIQDWKENNDQVQLKKVIDAAQQRIGNISFDQYEYATFFTEGIPYSFAIENIIPCSHVNLSIRPDLFVLNNIIYDSVESFHSAILFSPVFFQDEETDWLCSLFAKEKYFVRALIGREATLANFDFHAQFFPYDILHICSHGGEVDGYEITEKFVDRDGKNHVVEFEEVVGFTPVPERPGIVEVIRKAFPRKLDGFDWMSEELTKQNIPGHVYTDMVDCILKCTSRRKKKGRISMSCHIACVDSIHQGQFHTLASHSSPIIFNNACWSWSEVAAFFLDCGARGYIGTLWEIDNQDAVVAAKTFYEALVSGSVLTAFQKAIKAIEATESKDIYVYWGLHFTRFSPGLSPQESERRVRSELIYAADAWARKIKSTKSAEVKRNSIKILRSILRELKDNFAGNDVNAHETDVSNEVDNTSHTRMPRTAEDVDSTTIRSSVDFPREYRDIKEIY